MDIYIYKYVYIYTYTVRNIYIYHVKDTCYICINQIIYGKHIHILCIKDA